MAGICEDSFSADDLDAIFELIHEDIVKKDRETQQEVQPVGNTVFNCTLCEKSASPREVLLTILIRSIIANLLVLQMLLNNRQKKSYTHFLLKFILRKV